MGKLFDKFSSVALDGLLKIDTKKIESGVDLALVHSVEKSTRSMPARIKKETSEAMTAPL